MKKRFLVTGLSLWALPALAVDHNNIDAGRPLDFDDAESIAFREQTVEFGAAVAKPAGGKTGIEGSAEYVYGFAPNSHLSLDFDPSYSAGSNGKRRFDAGDLGVGIFHNFNREYGNTPAFSVRADAYLPTGRDSKGVDYRLRAIASKRVRQYDRLHLNLDLDIDNGTASDERKTRPGVILGYTHPLGYPTSFTRTLVAQVGYRANEARGSSGLVNVGIGIRQQIGVQSVLDFGIKSDVSGGANRERLALIAGYSRQF